LTVVNCHEIPTCLTLRSIPITETSSLLRPGLPAVSQPHPCCLLPLAILQNDTAFTCSLIQPVIVCCQLNPGYRVPGNQVSDTLGHGYKRNYPFLTSPFALTRLRHWFTPVQLTITYLQEFLFSFLALSLTTLQLPDNAA